MQNHKLLCELETMKSVFLFSAEHSKDKGMRDLNIQGVESRNNKIVIP